MQLAALAEHLGRLEETSARGIMVQRVAELLRRTTPNERAAVVYLLQAQLRPPYEGLEIGLGEKLLVRALAAAYATTESVVRRRLQTAGDLGSVAESLAQIASRGKITVRQA